MDLLQRIGLTFLRKGVAISLVFGLAVAGFLLDLTLPLGVAAGMPSVLAVLAAYLLPWAFAPIAAAVLASLSVVAGYAFSPVTGIPSEIVLTNRGLTLAVVWFVALALYGGRIAKNRIARLEQDVRDEKIAAERDRVVSAEMAHRLKNVLSQVNAIASVTIRSASSLGEASASVRQRINAVARAHDLMAANAWREAPIKALLRAEPALYGRDRFEISAEDIVLNPTAGFALAITMHELTTNAAKYGALSQPEGRVVIECRNHDDTLVIDWQEKGGPPVSASQNRGFGTKIIEGMIVQQLDGTFTPEFAPDGLRCRIEVPIEHAVNRPANPSSPT